jgi:hypothetical protein
MGATYNRIKRASKRTKLQQALIVSSYRMPRHRVDVRFGAIKSPRRSQEEKSGWNAKEIRPS